MALRLAGERVLAIQGADNQGWVRETTAQDALSGLKVNQNGTGRVFDFQDGGVSKMYLPDGGNVSLVGSLVFDLANDVTIVPANPAAPRTLTIPDPGSNDTFAFLAAAQTLTGKTLTSPTIQGTVGAGSGLTMPAFTAAGNITGGSGFQVATSAGNLVLNPAGQLEFSNKEMRGVGAYRSNTGSDLWVFANHDNAEATPVKVRIITLDPVADAPIVAAEAVPTATPTTPFWAQRADVTTPIDPTLAASFLTFKWNPANDQVSVYVNDGGVIRSAVIGTVV